MVKSTDLTEIEFAEKSNYSFKEALLPTSETLFYFTENKMKEAGERHRVLATEDVIIKIVKNTHGFVNNYIDREAPGDKEHIGYIIDRTGFEEYKKWAMEGIKLDPRTIVKNPIYWGGIYYD